MHEKINKTSENTVEGANKSAFNALAQMKDKFNPDKARQLIELEESSNIINSSSKPKLENVAHSISEENEKPENSNNIVEQSTLDVIPQSKKKAQRRLTLSDKYDIKERPRVDRLKSDLYSDVGKIFEYKSKQSASEPSIFKKVVRLIADIIGIKTKRGEELREREAMRVALIEYQKEVDAEQRAFEERKRNLEEIERKDILEKERREAAKKAAQEADKASQERKDLESAMLQARNHFDLRKQKRFKEQRIQEIVERDLNARLLTTDNLEAEVLSENPEIQKQSVLFDGVQIPVYSLKGLSFSILSTTVDFKKANEEATENFKKQAIGFETYKKVLANPMIWGERREDAEKTDGFGTNNCSARGDTISASYWNSDRNINNHVPGDLIYGFERVEPDSIISVFDRDGGTNNMAGHNEASLGSPDVIRGLEGADDTDEYNEILLRRYSENGIPKKPDYIITENGKITEAVLRHAKYFGVPIVNIDRASYVAKAEKKGEEIINSISDKDDYLDLDNKMTELLSMSEYRRIFSQLNILQLKDIGYKSETEAPSISPDASALEKQCLDIARIELFKRIDFIKTTLEDAIDKIKMDKRGKMDLSQVFSQFASFDIYITNAQNRTKSNERSDTDPLFTRENVWCNMIDVVFKLKAESRTVKTTIYDGERVFDGERILSVDEALAKGVRTKEYFKNADSSFYDTIEPLARKNFDEYRKNQGLTMN